MNILWVENHAAFARLVVRQFLSAHSVTIVPTLAAARAALTDSSFAIILVDFDLDDGKGVDLVSWMKSQPRPPRIVATSSHAAGNQALLDAGADAVCGKLEFAGIAAVVERLAIDEGVSKP